MTTSVPPTKKASATICPDYDATSLLTEPDFVQALLQKPGPSDGTCSDGKDNYKVDGSPFNLPSKCFCVKKQNVAG